jgi:pimeloyl-ACP methyl ester carboxylesterase
VHYEDHGSGQAVLLIHGLPLNGASWEKHPVLVVDDDGVGLDSHDGYVTGDQIGRALCRRLVARFGGVIELQPRSAAGTRGMISVSGADR